MNIEELIMLAINSKVISSSSGGGAGSLWLIEFENKESFYIYCSWRIEHNNQVLASSNDDIIPRTGRIARNVSKLEGQKFLSFSLTEQYDLTLNFEDNYCVRAFCDISYSATENGENYDTNWDYSVPDRDLTVSVTNYFKIKSGKYYS